MNCNTALFKEPYIYKITCQPTNKVYVGSSVNVAHRFVCHRADLTNNTHGNIHLQRAYNKYGAGVFEFSLVQPVANIENLRDIETRWIYLLGANDTSKGFNIQGVADVTTPNLGKPRKKSGGGWKLSAETCARMAKSRTGIKLSPESVAKGVAARKLSFKGLSPKQLEAMSPYMFKKGQISRNKGVPSPFKGTTRSQETVDRIKKSHNHRYWGQGLKLRIPVIGSKSGADSITFESAAAAKRSGYNNLTRAIKCGFKVKGYTWNYLSSL